MTQAVPASVGMSMEQVETPALVLDLDAFERNLSRMSEEMRAAGVRHRPHAKTHKCPMVARRQVALGAVGVCCQKVSEAEAMVAGGIDDVLVSNQVVGESKLRRLAALAREAHVAVCVDDAGNVDALDAMAARFATRIDVLVEVDVGTPRCGVQAGEPALTLARRVRGARNLRFAGLQCYHGAAQHVRSFEDRRAAVLAAAEKTRATVQLLTEHGVECETVAGAGTGTYRFEIETGCWNEIQAGSYVFMDADYARNLDRDGSFFSDFEQSLFVCATVMSTPEPGRVVVDAGLKASSIDSGMPGVHGLGDVDYFGPSDEHGNLDLRRSNHRLALGARVMLVPGHCDPTVNLYDWLVCMRAGVVQALWAITAREALA